MSIFPFPDLFNSLTASAMLRTSYRLGSAGGKTTVSHAQVSLVRRPRGFESPSGRKGLSLLASRGRALLSQGRDAAKAALGVDC